MGGGWELGAGSWETGVESQELGAESWEKEGMDLTHGAAPAGGAKAKSRKRQKTLPAELRCAGSRTALGSLPSVALSSAGAKGVTRYRFPEGV